MGFFKKAQSSYPGRRAQQNRINDNQRPPSSYGVQNPQPMPASVYESSGMPVAPPTAQAATVASATATAIATYGAAPVMPVAPPTAQAATVPPATATATATYGAALVQATVYVPPAPGAGAAPTILAPAAATAYVPGIASTAAQAHSPPTAPSTSTSYNHNQGHNQSIPPPQSHPPPPLNPSYNAAPNFQNSTYKTSESTYWECSVCTFPNLRAEPKCKGCGSAIPPGLALTPAPPANHLSMGGAASTGTGETSAGGVMRVHIPNGMVPGQKIKVQSPSGEQIVKVIPPHSEWVYDGVKPFFRMEFGASHQYAGSEAAPPHSTTWGEFYRSNTSRYSDPPLATRTVPHSPRGGPGISPNGRHKSLIIGINYVGQRSALRGCINDAKNMQALLQRNGFPNDGSHMLLLTDERNRGKDYQPTVENITKAFAWFMNDVRRGDVLFFHFSGHGGQQKDKTGHEADGYNETIIPVDFQRRGQITDDVLWGSLVYRLPEGARITALMDMCHSGTGLDLPFDYNVDTRRWKEDVNPAHSAGDVVLFSGCEDSQTSADVGGGYGKQAGGAMTQAFMGAYEAVGCATYHDFLVAVKKQLRKQRFSQRPQLTASQQFEVNSRIFSLGIHNSTGSIPSMIEPNHNPKVGRMLRRHVRPERQGFGGDLFGLMAGAAGAALVADALF